MKNFEQHVHDRFDGREVQVDKNELWANIAPQLEYKKKDKRGAWLFLLGLLTGGGLLGLYIMSLEKEDTNTAHAINTTTVKEQVSETLPTKEQSTIDLATAQKETALKSTIPTAPSDSPKTTIATNNTVIANTTTKGVALNNGVTAPSVSTSNAKLLTTNQNNIPVANQALAIESNSSDIAINDVNTDKAQSTIELSTLQLPLLNNPMFATKYTGTDNVFIEPQKSKSRFGLAFYGGISKTQSALKERGESKYDYAQLRGSTEDQLLTLHLGVGTIVELKRNIYLQTGLEYSRISSRLNLADEGILIDTLENTLIRNIDLTDTAVVIPDNTISKEVAANRTQTHFHLFDVPVLVGYQFGNARWRMGVEAGAFVNVSMRKEGEILQQELEIYDLKEDTEGWYKTNVGIRPYLGLTSTYDINQHYQLYFSTGITFNKVFSTDANPIREEKSMFGVRMGGRYFF